MGTVKIVLKDGSIHETPRENLRNVERLMQGRIDHIQDPEDAPDLDEIVIKTVGDDSGVTEVNVKSFGEMSRDEIKAEADKLGVEYHARISTAQLIERIEEKLGETN